MQYVGNVHGYQPMVNSELNFLNNVKKNTIIACTVGLSTYMAATAVAIIGDSNLLFPVTVAGAVAAGVYSRISAKDIQALYMLSWVGFGGGTMLASHLGETDFHSSITGLITGIAVVSFGYIAKKQIFEPLMP